MNWYKKIYSSHFIKPNLSKINDIKKDVRLIKWIIENGLKHENLNPSRNLFKSIFKDIARIDDNLNDVIDYFKQQIKSIK